MAGHHGAFKRKSTCGEGKSQAQVDKLDLKDDVLRRANGFYTYFAADIAYHRNKLEKRGFDTAINIWGPTTTDMWPGFRPPWTGWGWTAPTGWSSYSCSL